MIHIAAKAVLGPVLYAQARHVRKVALELPEPPGKRVGESGEGPLSLSLLIAGDSSAAGVGAPSQEQALAGHLTRELAARLGGRVAWQLVAETGARSVDVLHLLMRDNLRPADIGVVVVGVNDITKEVPLRVALRERGEIAALMRERAGVKHVIFLGLPEIEKFPLLPQPLAWYAGRHALRNNRAQAQWASSQAHISHASMDGVMHPTLMAADGYHPSPSLYARVSNALVDHILNKVLPALAQGPASNEPRHDEAA